MRRLASLTLAVVALATAAPSRASAQEWPTKPVHLVVPFVPGGATDVLGRLFAERLSPRLGQPVVIENKPGAGGNVGAAFVAKSPPDGTTMFIASSPGFTNAEALSKDAGFSVLREFAAVTLLATQSMLLDLHPSVPANTVQELVAYAKARPGQMSYGTPGIGTPHHLTMELFKQTAGLDIVHVPYRGGAPMTQDLLAGQVPLMFGSYVIAGPHLKTGKMKAIASSSSRRTPQTPEIPSIAEQGYPGFHVESWFALVAPKATPAAAIARMTREVQTVLQGDDFKQRLLQIGFEPPPVMTSKEFGELLASDVAKWSKVVKDVGIKAE